MPHSIVLLVILFFCSNAYSEDSLFLKNNSEFQWSMSDIKCPLEKENEKLFVINLSSQNKDYDFQINCYLQKKEAKKIVTYTIFEKSNTFFKEETNKSYKFEMTELELSFSDKVYSGYTINIDGVKQYGFNNMDGDVFNSLLTLNQFQVLVNDKIDKKEKYFEFVLDSNSAPLKTFEKFCSLDYFQTSN